MYHYQECGLNNIWLVNGYAVENIEGYGECVSISNIEGLQKAIGKNIINNKPRLTGSEFRFLRKELDLSQIALAELIGNDEQAIARWEKTGKVPKWADRLMRIFVQDYYGETGVRSLIERVRHIDHKEQERQLFEDDVSGWKKAA